MGADHVDGPLEVFLITVARQQKFLPAPDTPAGLCNIHLTKSRNYAGSTPCCYECPGQELKTNSREGYHAMSSEFLPQFYAAWGVEPKQEDSGTIRGVIALLEQWAGGELRAEDVLNPTGAMQRRLEEAARHNAAEIQANPQQSEPVRGHNERIQEGFEVCAEVLLEVQEGIENGARAEVAKLLDELKAAADQVTAARIALEDWMSSPEPLCPGCGGRGDGRSCQSCNLELLVPDPDAAEVPQSRQAQLGPEYVAVFQAYHAALSGRQPLSGLQSPLAQLQSRVGEWMNLSGSINDQAVNELLAELEGVLEGIAEGIDSMESAFITRRVSDLNRGWREIFNNAVAMQNLLPELGAAAGEPAEVSPATTVGEDSVSLSF